MSLSFVALGTAVAVAGTAVPPYPTGLSNNDLLVLSVTSDGSAIGDAGAGWTERVADTAAGGMRIRQWTRPYDGTTPAVSITCTGGTVGEAHIAAYRSSIGTTPSVLSARVGLDTDTSSTAFSCAAGTSWTPQAGDLIVESAAALAPSGSYSAGATGATITQSGASITYTSRTSGRTGTNRVWYNHASGAVTSGGTGAPVFSATTVGANAGGIAGMILLREVTNQAPVANAGADQSAAQGSTVTLNGTGSTDPDGSVVSYAWTQISGTAVTLSDATAAQPTFTAPAPGSLVFGLIVTDNLGSASAQDTVTVTTTAAGNAAPVVTADKASIQAGETVTFTGSDSDGSIASWAVTPGFTLAGSGGTRTLVAPPRATGITITVTVTDDDGATDSVDVVILAAPLRVFHAGAWRPAYLKAQV